jgi:uncharacterized protein
LITGPRAVGKTTSAARHAKSVIRLDRPNEAAVVLADPDAALRGLAEPILIDEWQLVPSVLWAVKRAVDDDRRPGRFIITGSVNAELDSHSWPGTGRLVRIKMTSLTVREIDGLNLNRPSFLDFIATNGMKDLPRPAQSLDLRDYVELVARGGFPETVELSSESVRHRWAKDYLEQLFTRDVDQADGRRDPLRLARYFEAYALNIAGVTTDQTIIQAAGVNRKTADSYEQLLRKLFIADVLPAWSTNRLKRLIRTPKRYVTDSGLVTAALRLGVDGLMRDGDLIGRLLDTFVCAQLRAEQAIMSHDARLYHLRDQNGAHEVDILAELDINRVIAIEVKATSAPTLEAARHLQWLQHELGDRFTAGILFHTGPRVFRLADQIIAAPISTLWS